ncbi:Uncharacterised protein [Vibrio cholerae]|nr:Uncharacterised protein [Vibrio cholerae]CSC60247.1 Uncharacterised protein [Vibrio cholerae]CSC77340.1 Uncharacterised protein [Vibrio cholerae]
MTRAHELRFFHVNDRAGFRHRFNQVGLTGQKGRQLNHIHHIRHRLRLRFCVDISDDLHAKGLFQLLENFHPFFQAWATVRVH